MKTRKTEKTLQDTTEQRRRAVRVTRQLHAKKNGGRPIPDAAPAETPATEPDLPPAADTEPDAAPAVTTPEAPAAVLDPAKPGKTASRRSRREPADNIRRQTSAARSRSRKTSGENMPASTAAETQTESGKISRSPAAAQQPPEKAQKQAKPDPTARLRDARGRFISSPRKTEEAAPVPEPRLVADKPHRTAVRKAAALTSQEKKNKRAASPRASEKVQRTPEDSAPEIRSEEDKEEPQLSSRSRKIVQNRRKASNSLPEEQAGEVPEKPGVQEKPATRVTERAKETVKSRRKASGARPEDMVSDAPAEEGKNAAAVTERARKTVHAVRKARDQPPEDTAAQTPDAPEAAEARVTERAKKIVRAESRLLAKQAGMADGKKAKPAGRAPQDTPDTIVPPPATPHAWKTQVYGDAPSSTSFGEMESALAEALQKENADEIPYVARSQPGPSPRDVAHSMQKKQKTAARGRKKPEQGTQSGCGTHDPLPDGGERLPPEPHWSTHWEPVTLPSQHAAQAEHAAAPGPAERSTPAIHGAPPVQDTEHPVELQDPGGASPGTAAPEKTADTAMAADRALRGRRRQRREKSTKTHARARDEPQAVAGQAPMATSSAPSGRAAPEPLERAPETRRSRRHWPSREKTRAAAGWHARDEPPQEAAPAATLPQTETGPVAPREAAAGVTPREALAGGSAPADTISSTFSRMNTAARGIAAAATERARDHARRRSQAEQTVRSGAVERAAAQKAARTYAEHTERLASGEGAGRYLPVLLSAVLVAAALIAGMSIAFLAAAGGSAEQTGGAGYMDVTVVQDMKREIGAAWTQQVADLREELLAEGASVVRVRYNASDTGDGDTSARLDNWNDVLAIWLARSNRVITAADTEDVKAIYFALNPIMRGPAEEGGVQYIDVQNLRAPDAAAQFSLGPTQLADIASWISPASDGSAFWTLLLGSPVSEGSAFSPGYLSVDPGSAAQIVLQEAQNRAGWIYSQERRTQRGYADCSSLVAAAYRSVGVELGGPWPTAAEMASYCDSISCRVPSESAQPGDLIFWGGRDNGRYLGVYHTALYAGDGMMWEAAPSAGGVVYRPVQVQSPSRILFYARPLAVLAGSWSSTSLPAGVSGSRTMVLSTTAYCEACDTIYGDGRTASGTIPQRGTVATSRTRQFPFGTRLYIPGYGYGTVEDIGGFADGTIDLYIGHRSECTCGTDWGRKTMTVYILS